MQDLILKEQAVSKSGLHCETALKSLWANGSEDKSVSLVVDKLQLTSLLAAKSYDDLLAYFLTQL
jgi:hypothetical protein